MNLDEAMSQLESLGAENVRAHRAQRGTSDNQFGALLGAIRKLAAPIKRDAALARRLWATDNCDAQLMAILLLRPSDVDEAALDRMVRPTNGFQVADWLNAYLVKKHKRREALRQRWMQDDDALAARAGWNLTYIRVEKSPDGLDLSALLDRIEAEMADAPEASRWTMNFTLAAIGIHSPDHRERALAIGEALGVYRDFPVSKGCTSPFAPIWIREMVRRSEA